MSLPKLFRDVEKLKSSYESVRQNRSPGVLTNVKTHGTSIRPFGNSNISVTNNSSAPKARWT